jgi:hypothetical protein
MTLRVEVRYGKKPLSDERRRRIESFEAGGQ